MSRGLGVLQRRVCEVLDGAEGNELALRELRRRLGEPDRSNLRRAIRGLLEREIVEELRVGSERRVRVASWAHVSRKPATEPSRPRAARRTRPPAPERALKEAMEEARRLPRLEAAEGTMGMGSRRRLVRKREVGETQGRILGALWHYSDPLEKGLPVTAVKAMVGGDRSNTRRAIRTLLRNGSLAELEGGECVRLSSRTASYFSFVGPERVPPAPVDVERAEEILRAHEAAKPT
jgi:hypothetical protein